jgi:hypothetical protein
MEQLIACFFEWFIEWLEGIPHNAGWLITDDLLVCLPILYFEVLVSAHLEVKDKSRSSDLPD